MFGNRFYNETTRRLVAVFGTLFNDISINRKNSSNEVVQEMIVPINYAPMQKLLARLDQDPDLDAPAITLPRMSFEMMNMTFDAERKLLSTNQIRIPGTTSTGDTVRYVPSPYDIEFELNVMTKYSEDGMKIIEQIIPFFKPDINLSVKLIDGLDPIDIPVVLNSVSKEDVYEASFEERRVLIWTLNFTMKAFFYGPPTDKKVIKFVENNLHSSLDSDQAFERLTVQPGLDANNNPTTDSNNTINYTEIFEDDDWAYIVKIESL